MAGESVVGALRVVLGMDIVQFEEGSKKAQAAAQGLGSELSKIFKEVIAIETLRRVVEGIGGIVESMDQMGKTAQKVGTSVEEFSALKYAAGLADVGVDDLANSLEKLNKNMSAVAGGARGPAADAFRVLGISVTDGAGQLKSTADVLGEVSDKFAGFKDGAAKTALAMAIFNRGGAEMIAFLNEGSKGIKEASDEAAKFGLVIGSTAANAAQNLNDNIKRLQGIMQGAFMSTLPILIDELTKISQVMIDAGSNSDKMQVVMTGLAAVMKYTAAVVEFVVFDISQLVKTIGLLVDVSKAIGTGDFSRIPDLLAQYKNSTADAAVATYDAIKALLGFNAAAQTTNPQLAAMATGMKALADQKPDAPILATKTALDHFIDSTKKSIAAQQAEFDTFGAAAGVREKAKFLLEAEAVAKANDITITGQQKVAIDALAASLEIMNQKLAGQQIVQELLTPWQLYQQQLAQIGVLLQSNSISLDTYAQKSSLLALNMQQAYATAMQGIVSNVASAFKDLAAINKNYATLAKAAAIGEAIVNTYVGATKALATVPPPFNYAAAAAVVAAGLASVAKIVATPFATGGSFKVGGAGGVDSQMVTIAATPGEMVDVRRPDQAGGFGGEIVLRGVAPNDIFTGDMLRGLFDALNQGQRDGYKLVIAER